MIHLARIALAAVVLSAAAVATMPGAAAQSSGCRNTLTDAPGGGIAVAMAVPHDGRCAFYAGNAIAGMQLATPPRNGRVEIVGNAALYAANPGYAGADSFTVTGTRAGTRIEATISVTVR